MASKRKRLEDRIWKVVREIVLIRDNYTCQKCGKHMPTGLHGSHVFGRGAHRDPHMKYDIQNVKALCYFCHMWWGSTPIESSEWFKKKFPSRLKYLKKKIIDRKGTGTVSYVDLEEMYEELKDQLKEMK